MSSQQPELKSVQRVQEPRFIGRSIRRKEDARFLSGRANYITDIRPPGSLTAVFVRSPYAHAVIKSVDVEEASRSEGVFAVFRGSDIIGHVGEVPCAVRLPFAKYPKHHPIAAEEVNFAGEIVAVVLAEDEYLARDAAELVKVDYDPLAPVVDPEKAAAEPGERAHLDLPDNIAYALKESFGDVDSAFEKAPHRFSFRIRNQRVTSLPMEPRCVVASFDKTTEELTLWTSTQIPHIARTFVARELGFPENKFRVIAPDIGGGFGGKSNIYAEEILIPYLARRVGRPIRWTETRSESFAATAHARDVMQWVDVAVEADGTIRGMKVRQISDTGAYYHILSPAFPLIIVLSIPGAYRIRAYAFDVTVVFTNKKGVDAYRGVANAEANFCMERVLDGIARKLHLDPAEVRFRNHIGQDEHPYVAVTGSVYERSDLPYSLRRVMELMDYASFRDAQKEQREKGRYLGIGLSSFWEIAAVGPPPMVEQLGLQHGGFESASVRVLPSGYVVVTTGSATTGQGHETSYAQIAADFLGLTPEDVTVQHGDTLNSPYGIGSWSSRSTSLGGSALKLACEKVVEKASRIAASRLESDAADIEYSNGVFRSRKNGKSATFREVANQAYIGVRLPEGMEPGLEAVSYFSPPQPNYPSGTHAAIVEVQPDTGKVRVLRYAAVNDFARIVNPMMVEGQLQGGVIQGVGQALLEEVVHDESGNLLTSSMLDYLLPTPVDPVDVAPENFEVEYYSNPTSSNPLGVKGMGESGTIAAPAAIVNAVEDALAFLDLELPDMPLKPAKLRKMMKEGKRLSGEGSSR